MCTSIQIITDARHQGEERLPQGRGNRRECYKEEINQKGDARAGIWGRTVSIKCLLKTIWKPTTADTSHNINIYERTLSGIITYGGESTPTRHLKPLSKSSSAGDGLYLVMPKRSH